jgi:hypothetical protein
MAWMSVGCAEERDPINKVQPQAIPKSFFLGANFDDPSDNPEFYARSMVIDVPYGINSDAFTFTNTINKITRIKWEMTEHELIGRVAYERLQGTDGKGVGRGQKSLEGQVAFVFPVISHFDIRRSYNPATGEESNVIEENTSDRPWNQREYVRIDWSKNLNTTSYDFDTLAFLGVVGGYSYEPLAYNVSDPNAEDAPQYDLKNGYLDVTNKVFASPQMVQLPAEWGGGAYPSCFLSNLVTGGQAPNQICNAEELTIRHSFMRVVDHDYEPADWDGFKFQAFGAFLSERQGYTREYGLTDNKWWRFVERYNIWNRSHYYKDPVSMSGPKTCKVDADCAGVGDVGGSHCDLFNNKCTLPFRKREAKPVVWYYADKSNADFYDASRMASFEWDTAMRLAVAASRYAECMRYGDSGDCGDPPVNGQIADEEDAVFLIREIEDCRDKAGRRSPDFATKSKQCDALADDLASKRGYSPSVAWLAKQPTMVHLCHSPVIEADPLECGEVGTKARLGDLRHHLVVGVTSPQTGSPWGIMSDANDPLTGEKVSASINVWTDVNDRFAQSLVDTIRYIAGELKTSDITEGKYIYDWAEAARLAASQGQVMPRTSPAEVNKAAAAMFNMDPQRLATFNKPLPEELKVRMKQVEKQMHDLAFSADAPSTTLPIYNQRRQQAQGSPLEAELSTPAMQQLARSAGVAVTGADPVSGSSIFRGLNPTVIRQMRNALELGYAKRGMCVMDADFMATAPLGYVALGEVLQAKFGKFNPQDSADEQYKRAEKMKDYIRRRAHYAVISHEMGHSFGLRHNFVSSSDPLNYRPQYWQLRTNDKKVTQECTAPVADGSKCIGPRRYDPVTTNESKNLIQMWSQSSTMEYPGEPTQDMVALGAYDFGAAMAFYGDVASVYAEGGKVGTTLGDVAVTHQNDFGGLLGISYEPIAHYTQLDKSLNLIKDCQPVDVQAFKPTNWNDAKDGEWSPLVDGFLVTNEEGQTTRCKQQPVDYVQFGQLNQPNATSGRNSKPYSFDGDRRTRVPFGFASDDWADLGNVSVYRHDNGADLYEIMHFWMAQQEVNHIFTNYRRGRSDFSIWSAFQRTLTRYHEKMRDSAKAMGLFVNAYRDLGASFGQDGDAFVARQVFDAYPDNILASAIGFDHFAHVFARPQPGEHGFLDDSDKTVLRSLDDLSDQGKQQLNRLLIPNGVTGSFGQITLGGRPLENALANNKGNYDRDYTLNVGSYYEKAYTAMLFTESADNFISSQRGDFYDPRFRATSIADVFPDGFRRWLANNLTGDETIKGARVRSDGAGTPSLDPAGLPSAGIGWTQWWPTNGTEACFPGAETIVCRDPSDKNPSPVAFPTMAVDSDVGWEQQKFAIAMTLMYLPENQKVNWLNQMMVWMPGEDPGFANKIEFHDPTGDVYIAQTFGTETLYGKTVQKGIAARMIEWANELLQKAYVVTPVTQNGVTWYEPVLDANGQPQVKNPRGAGTVATCGANWYCTRLQAYVPLFRYIRKAYSAFNYTREMKGVFR